MPNVQLGGQISHRSARIGVDELLQLLDEVVIALSSLGSIVLLAEKRCRSIFFVFGSFQVGRDSIGDRFGRASGRPLQLPLRGSWRGRLLRRGRGVKKGKMKHT